MKTTTAAAIAFFLMMSLGAEFSEGVEVQKPGFFRRTFGHLTWEEAQSLVKKPEDAASMVRSHVRFKLDLGDQWESAEATWRKGSGDCEDMAQCVVDLCRQAGLEASVMVFGAKGLFVGHAVAMGKYPDGKVWIASNGWFYRVKSVDAAKEIVAGELRWGRREVTLRPLSQVYSASNKSDEPAANRS